MNKRLYNGKEWNEDIKLYDYGARWLDHTIGRWNGVDALAEKYARISPFAYVANMPISAIDPDGKRIIFINGKIGGGSPPAGAPYWNGRTSDFVKGAQKYFNDYDTPFFTNEDYGYLNGARSRKRQGRAYAKANIVALTDGLDKKKDVFRLVTHSMGGAFGEGLKEHLESEGWTVETVLMLNTFESDELEYSPGDPTTIINYHNTDDPVVGLFDNSMGGKAGEGIDINISEKSNSSSLITTHRYPIDNPKRFWSSLGGLIKKYLRNQTRDYVPVDNSNRGEK